MSTNTLLYTKNIINFMLKNEKNYRFEAKRLKIGELQKYYRFGNPIYCERLCRLKISSMKNKRSQNNLLSVRICSL